MEISKTWTELKSLISIKGAAVQYVESTTEYTIWIADGADRYIATIDKDSPATTDQSDFEANYKTDANKPLQPVDEDGKTFVRSESRPLGHTTNFTMAGDGATTIGDGKELKWDFSNTDDDVTAPTGFKRKRIEFEFIDSIYVKEGTLYFKDKLFGSYIDLYVVCKDTKWYLKNDGTPAQASGDTIVSHYLNRHFVLDTNVYGDELNTEAASSQISTDFKFWLEITVPDTDSSSKGFAELELYRTRTVIL